MEVTSGLVAGEQIVVRPLQPVAAAGLDLHEDQQRPAPGDEVHFAARDAEAPGEDREALGDVPQRRDLLAAAAERRGADVMLHGHLPPPGQQEAYQREP